MTRDAAVRELRALTIGLDASSAGVSRLLERIASSDAAEELRAGLIEGGARALIESQADDGRQR